MNAKPAPHSSIASVVGEIFTELGLVAVYALMFALTVALVLASAIVYAALAIPRWLTQASVDNTGVPSSERSAPALWQANPSGGRR